MQVPPLDITRRVIGWVTPFRFTPLPFGLFLFAFHLLRGSLVYLRLILECLCSHYLSTPFLHMFPHIYKRLLLHYLYKTKQNMAKIRAASEMLRGAASKERPSTSTPHPIITWELAASNDGDGPAMTLRPAC